MEQPCEVGFFKEALRLLDSGYDLVRANRRLAESWFQVPVRLLSLVYSRHRLGLTFNRWVRRILPIHTTDTHSGNFAISWRLALTTFAVQTSPDFLFDLELSLTSVANQFKEKDLPVSISLEGEKTAQRMMLETLNILIGLPTLAWRFKKGYYRGLSQESNLGFASGITADDWGLSPGVNQGILKLARLGVVRRVSIMAGCPFLKDGLKELAAIPRVELGLHFTLTYGRPLQKNVDLTCPLIEQTGPKKGLMLPSPGKFLLRWLNPLTRRENCRNYIRAELMAQLDQVRSCGIRLSYLDGHHHIHIMPGLIDMIADLILAEGIKTVRLPYDPALWMSSQAPLTLLARLAKARIKKHGFHSPPCFYPQRSHFSDQGRLRAELTRHSSEGGSPIRAEVIVHPAEMDDVRTLELPDEYSTGRVTEFQALRMLGLGVDL